MNPVETIDLEFEERQRKFHEEIRSRILVNAEKLLEDAIMHNFQPRMFVIGEALCRTADLRGTMIKLLDIPVVEDGRNLMRMELISGRQGD